MFKIFNKLLTFKNFTKLTKCFKHYKYIPNAPTWKPQFYPDKIDSTLSIDYETVYLLERLSLIDFGTSKSVQVLIDGINFVSDIKAVDTKLVEPKSRIWDDGKMWLRDEDDQDIQWELVDTIGTVAQVTNNAKHVFEDYFTAPIGNKPIEKDEGKAESYNIAHKSKL